MNKFARNIRPAVDHELKLANARERTGQMAASFRHLERAHILGQASTREHVRVHYRMLLWGLRQRAFREVIGQVTRIVGAATKTFLGWVPTGNTGGANISPFRPLPIPEDLRLTIERAK